MPFRGHWLVLPYRHDWWFPRAQLTLGWVGFHSKCSEKFFTLGLIGLVYLYFPFDPFFSKFFTFIS